jgi:hypothetical protein
VIWLRGLIGARWFLPAVILVPSVAAAVFGWGYMKGWSASTQKAVEKERLRMQAVMDFKLIRAEQEIRALSSLLDDERQANEINNMPHIGNIGCPVEPDRLRDLQDAVRSANGLAGADQATATDEGAD